MTDKIVAVESISKTYRIGGSAVHALSDVSIAIGRGEFISVMGPSGSGKSTFMNLIGCLDTPDHGDIWINGERTATLNRDDLARIRNREIGFVFQQFNLLGRTTALDNVSLPLLYAGVNKRDQQSRAAEALSRVGLEERINHQPTELSGGQQQRVAIARALVNEPSLILADEPTGALDSRTGAEIMALFQSLNDAGITIIVVTHEQSVATAAKRIVHFLDGQIVSDESSMKDVA